MFLGDGILFNCSLNKDMLQIHAGRRSSAFCHKINKYIR